MVIHSHGLRSKRTTRLLIVLVAVLGLITCWKSCLDKVLPDRKLDGEVFIVTKSGMSIKLGLVPIRLYSCTDFVPYFNGQMATASNEIARLEYLAEAAEAESDTLSTNAAEMEVQAIKLYREWVKTSPLRPLRAGESFDEWAKAYIATLQPSATQSEADDYFSTDDKYNKYRAASKSVFEKVILGFR